MSPLTEESTSCQRAQSYTPGRDKNGLPFRPHAPSSGWLEMTFENNLKPLLLVVGPSVAPN
jgi:hypothetical protein